MWRQDYARNRKAKYQNSEEERERRKKQNRTSDENKIYMRGYYKRNPDKFKRNPEQDDERNRRRRERYANDEVFREKTKADAKNWGANNRHKQRTRVIRKYGLTPEIYNRMLEEQNKGCAICGSSIPNDNKTKRLYIDHCHASGKVRGLLCAACNFGLGKFRDNPELLDRAAMYLRSFVRSQENNK